MSRIELSKQGKKAKALLRRGIKQGLNTTEIQQLLREHGLGYNRQKMLADIRALTGKPKRKHKGKEKPQVQIVFEEDCCPSERLRDAMMEIWDCDEDTFYDTYFDWLKEYCKAIAKGDEPPPFPYEA